MQNYREIASGARSSIGQIHRARNQRVGVRVAPLTDPTSDPLWEFIIPVPASSGSAGLEVLVPKEGLAPSLTHPTDLIAMATTW